MAGFAAPSPPVPSPETPLPPVPSPVPTFAGVKPEISPGESRECPSAASSRSREPSRTACTAITIPSHSRWFSWSEIHETERRMLPEFFDRKSPSKNPRVYKYYRDFIIGRFREDPTRKITFTEVRRGLAGDVGSVRRVFDFLETWGLINYAPSTGKQGSKDEEKKKGVPPEDGSEKKESALKKFCTSCKTACTLYCFATDKADTVLCAKCYVRSNYRAGLTSADFKRVDIGVGVETKSLEWSDKETLHLLEAALQFGDDWRKVAEHVGGGRSEKDCVQRFIKLPFGEQFMGSFGTVKDGGSCRKRDQADVDTNSHVEDNGEPSPRKRMHLTPLADASNPILAQVVFLSAMVGKEVAETAAQAAVAALYEVDQASFDGVNGRKIGLAANKSEEVEAEAEAITANDLADDVISVAWSHLEKEQQDMEQSISDILEVQMKGIKEKIVHFEEKELLMEKERLQLQYMKNMLFEDQLNILQQRNRLSSVEGEDREKVRASVVIS